MTEEIDILARAEQLIVREPPFELPGPEDIVIDHRLGVALVACQQRLSDAGTLLEANARPDGAVVALDLNGPVLLARPLIDGAALKVPFHPRGCSLFVGEDKQRRLLVISDRTPKDSVVELFEVRGDTFAELQLQHLRTILDNDHLVSPNDLVAVDGDRFYVTNDHGTRTVPLCWLEDVFGLPLSTVEFWDGTQFHQVAGGIAFANGIALDRTRNRLYVASTRSKKLHVYDWDASEPGRRLTERAAIRVPGCPDNLEWDEEGQLWIGADPSFLDLAFYAMGLRRFAPSQILRVRFDATGEAEVDEIWRDESGQTISANSVAAVHGRGPVRRLLIGQPFGDFVRDCELRSA